VLKVKWNFSRKALVRVARNTKLQSNEFYLVATWYGGDLPPPASF
jgi:hypothetical protein